MHIVPLLRKFCRLFLPVLLLLSIFPAVLSAVDTAAVTSVADSVASIVERVLNRSASMPALSMFPGDRLSFSNLAYNRADGLFLGVGSDKRHALRFDPALLAHISLGYSFGSHYWQVTGGLARRFGERDAATVIGAEGHHHTDSHDGWKVPAWENSIHAFFAREDYLTLFRRTGWSIYAEQSFSRDLSVAAKFGRDRYEPLGRSISWSLFGGDKTFPENIDFGESDVRTLSFAVRYNGMPRIVRAAAGVRVSLQVEKAWRDEAYERWLAEVVLHRPLARVFTLNSRLRIGSLTGAAFSPKLFAIGGAGTLPGYGLNEFAGNRVVLWNTELLLHGSAFIGGRIGSSLSLVLFCDVGYAGFAPESDALWEGLVPEQIGRLKTDLGVALASANAALRIGAVWRTDRGESPSIVVRLSPALITAR